MPVFENFPYTNFHELNLDYILKEIKDLKEETERPAVKGAKIKNHTRYYIDGVNGKDDNPGTAGAPFKTIDRFLDLSDEYSELRCYIVEPGTYKIRKGDNFSDINIHITATAANVVLDFCPTSTETQVSGYNCHWNIQGKSNAEKMTVTGHDISGNLLQTLYFDNSLMNFTNCDIQVYFRTFSGALFLAGCTLKQITLNSTFVTISDGTHISNTDPDIVPLTFVNCVGRLIGTFTGEELDAAGNVAFCYLNQSYMICGSVIVPNNTNQYLYGVQLVNGGMFTITAARLASIAARASSGNYADAFNVIVTDEGTISAEATRYHSGSLQYWDGSAWTNV